MSMSMSMVPPPGAPHPMMQTDPAEWSRYMAAMFFAQYDREGNLRGFRYYIPAFVLKAFATSGRAKVSQSSAGYYYNDEATTEETDMLVLYDPKTMRFDRLHWSECYGEANIYGNYFDNFKQSAWQRERWTQFEKLQRLDREIFSALNEPIWHILHQYQAGNIPIKRGVLNTIRKFLFLTTSVRNRDRNQHLLAKDQHMEDARMRRKQFMEQRLLEHPRDIWLHNCDLILNTPHFDIGSDPDIFDLDREDYLANARERFAVFWQAGPGEEFVLTDNAFGCFEGGALGGRRPIKLTARENEQKLYTRDFMWHQIFVISPKLVLALCHGSLVHPVLSKAHRHRWGLRRSLLEGLPHNIAMNYYKDLAKGEVSFLRQAKEVPVEVERLFGTPRSWDGKVIAVEQRENDDLILPVATLTAQQVSLINCVILQNQSTMQQVQSVSFRPPTSYRSLHDSLVEFEKMEWKKITDEPQHDYGALHKRLAQYLSKLDEIRSNESAPTLRLSSPTVLSPHQTPEPQQDARRPPPPRQFDQQSEADTMLTVTPDNKKDRRRNTNGTESNRGLPTPPITQPHSRESSMAPSQFSRQSSATSTPQPILLSNRAPSTDRSNLSQLTERTERPSAAQAARAPSSDRATTVEIPMRRNNTSTGPPPASQNQQNKPPAGRTPSNERRFTGMDGIRVEPPPPPPMPEFKRERGSSTQSEHRSKQNTPAQANGQAPPPPRPVMERQYSVPAQAVPPVQLPTVLPHPNPIPTPAHDARRPVNMERRHTEQAPRVELHSRPSLAEKRFASSQSPPTVPPIQERPSVIVEKKEPRQTTQSPSRSAPQSSSQTPTPAQQQQQNIDSAARVETPKLSKDQLDFMERQRRLEQQRAEQEKVAQQQRAEKEGLQRAEEQRRLEEMKRAEEQKKLEQQKLEQQKLDQKRLEEQRKAEQARIEEQRRLEHQRQEEQRRIDQQRAEQQRAEQQRIERERIEQLRLEQEHQRRVEQERRNLEQVRLEQQQQQAQLAAANAPKSRDRSSSAHSIAETIRDNKASFERQTQMSEVSVESGSSESSGSSGSRSGSGSGNNSDRTARPIKLRGNSASPRRRPLLKNGLVHPRALQLKTQYVVDDNDSMCGGAAESLIVEVDDEEQDVWIDEGYAEVPPIVAPVAQHQELELFPKPRKPIVRFASPKPGKKFEAHSPTTARKAVVMASSQKVRHAGHVQHAASAGAQQIMHATSPLTQNPVQQYPQPRRVEY